MQRPIAPDAVSSADATPPDAALLPAFLPASLPASLDIAAIRPGTHLRTHEEFCRAVLALAPYVAARGMDQNARQVAEASCAHFDAALRLHLETQETELFDALRLRASGGNMARIQRLLDQLKAEHLRLAAAWIRLRESLNSIEFCRFTTLTIRDVEEFTLPYLRHLQTEENHLHPLATHILLGQRDVAKSTLRLRERPLSAKPGAFRWSIPRRLIPPKGAVDIAKGQTPRTHKGSKRLADS